MTRLLFAFGIVLLGARVDAESLTDERVSVVYNLANPASARIAAFYAARRGVPAVNVVGLSVPEQPVVGRGELVKLRDALIAQLPSSVQSLLLVWSRPYAVECMSITTAFAAGYQPGCEAGCGRTE